MTSRARPSALPLLCLALTLLPAVAAGQPAPGDQAARWHSASIHRMPEAIASFGAASLDGWVYIASGHTGRAHAHSRENLSSAFRRAPVGALDVWQDLPGGRPRQGMALVAHEGGLVRIGGLYADNAPGEDERLLSVAEVERFDTLANTWNSLASLPEPRSSHDAISGAGSLWVVGGWKIHAQGRDWADHTLRWKGKAWERIEQPFRRRALATAVHAGRVYAIGGLNEAGKVSRRVDVYDIKAGTWERGPDLPAAGFGATALTTPSGLVVSLMDGNLYQLQNDATEWQPVGSLVFPRFFHRMVQGADDELIAIGGASRGGHLASVERLAIADRSALGHFTTASIPWSASARNRQVIFSSAREVWFFGGNRTLDQHAFNPENFTAEGRRLDLLTLTEHEAPALPFARQSLVGWSTGQGADRRFHVAGGFGHDGKVARAQDDRLAFDPKRVAWQPETAKLPDPLTQYGAVGSERGAVLIGGLDYDPSRAKKEQFAHRDEIWTEDDAEGWRLLGRLPSHRRAFGYAKVGQQAYIFGGMTDNFGSVPEFLSIDLNDGTSTALPMPPESRISSDLVACGEYLVLVGGSHLDGRRAQPADQIELYHIATKTWTRMKHPLPFSSRHARAFAWGRRVLVLSTHNDSGRLHMAWLTLAGQPRNTRGLHPTGG